MFNWGWEELDSADHLADLMAQDLGKRISPLLTKQGSKVVYLNVTKCTVGTIVTDNWCSSFRTSLQNALIARNIRFLDESKQADIRAKIANEQVYQQTSQQVDVNQTVELGKQAGFQAYVNIELVESEGKTVRASIESINITEGVVTISEQSRLSLRREESRTFGGWFWGLTNMAIGGAATAYGINVYYVEGDKADKAHARYKKATNAEDATKARKEAETEATKANAGVTAAAVGLCLGLWGIHVFNSSMGEDVYYRMEKNDKSDLGTMPSKGGIHFGLIADPRNIGAGFELNF